MLNVQCTKTKICNYEKSTYFACMLYTNYLLCMQIWSLWNKLLCMLHICSTFVMHRSSVVHARLLHYIYLLYISASKFKYTKGKYNAIILHAPTLCNVSNITCYMSHVSCHVSHVSCHVSHVTCLMSRVICHMMFVTWHLSLVTCHLSPVNNTKSLSHRRSPC